MSASGQNGTPVKFAVTPTGRLVAKLAISDIASVRASSKYSGLNDPAWLVSVPAAMLAANGGVGPGHGVPSEPR